MESAKERIKQNAKPAHKMQYYAECITVEEALQILAEFKTIPLGEWCELLNPLKRFPKTDVAEVGDEADEWFYEVGDKLKEIENV